MRMNTVGKQIFAVLITALVYAGASYAQTKPAAAPFGPPSPIPRDPTSASIHEGVSGRTSAGFKTNINPLVGNLPASYFPFRGLGRAIGSLVQQYGIGSPNPSDTSSYGFKPTIQNIQALPSQTRDVSRLFPGQKGIGGKNVTDVSRLGTPGGKNPGDPYWVAYPRPGNVEFPPFAQLIHHPYDCFCRWDETIRCPLQESPFWHVAFGAPWVPPHFTPVSCQACFGVQRIRKHDFYVGQSKSGVFDGYPFTYPYDTGYQECLRESIDSFAASGPGGVAPGEPALYGL